MKTSDTVVLMPRPMTPARAPGATLRRGLAKVLPFRQVDEATAGATADAGGSSQERMLRRLIRLQGLVG